VEVGKKGYVIIPKGIRDLLGIKEGDKLTLNVYDGKIILEPERKVDLTGHPRRQLLLSVRRNLRALPTVPVCAIPNQIGCRV